MKKIILFVLCFFLISTDTYGDHYTDVESALKFDQLKNSVVLITTEFKQDVRQPGENPFDKFLEPNPDDSFQAPKTDPEIPDKLVPEEGTHQGEDAPADPPGGMGTGFWIDEQHIVTNYHVVKKASNLKVYAYNYPFVINDVTLIGYDESIDIAVLRVGKKVDHNILQWDTVKPIVGYEVYAIGHGAGQIWSVTFGIISNTYRPNYSSSVFIHYYQTDAVINSGNSGGILVGVDGHIVGVPTLIISPTKYYVGYGYAIPSILAKRVVDQIIATGYHIRPSIGIIMGTVDKEEDYLQLLEQGVTSILEIKEVLANSPAKRFGLQAGDLIVDIDGNEIQVIPQVIEILWTKMPGDVLKVKVYRNGEYVTLDIVLDEGEAVKPRVFNKEE